MRALLPLHLIHSILALAAASEVTREVEASEVYEAALSRITAATATASPPTTSFAELDAPLDICRYDPWHYLSRVLHCSPDDETSSAVELIFPKPEPPGSGGEAPSSGNAATTDPPGDEPFESFEDWKRRREAREAEHLPPPPDPTPQTVENASEQAPDPPVANISADDNSTRPALSASSSPAPSAKSTKGHRYNYASPDCSARVLSSSPLTQHASSLLHKSKDRYMLTPCRAEQHWAVVELCDEIRIEAVELAVWEFFSGIVRSVRVSVADDADGEWEVVGEFVGKNVRGAQTFTLPEPTSFHRFLRLDFPSFYGSEYYCPVSQLKVYGMNQMEAFKMEQRRAAEASGAQEEKVRAAEREAERVAEAARVSEREAREKEDDKRRQRELCELERLVQEQARRVSGLDNVFEEPLIECAPSPATQGSPSVSPSGPSTAGEAVGANGTERAHDAPAQEPQAPSSSGSGSGLGGAPPAGEPAPAGSTQSAYRGSGRTDASESIYAFITRRLNALEGNTTLVARYIDEQAKALRAALERAERKWEDERGRDAVQYDMERLRQEDRLARILGQLEHMRTAFDAERRSTETQLQLLADELGFERRRSLAQLVALVSVIVLGALSRGEAIDALLRPLSATSQRRARDSARGRVTEHERARDIVGNGGLTSELRQKRLSTGPLAGLLIDVAPLPDLPRDSEQPTSPSTPRGGKRRPLPASAVRRRTPGTRSISAADAAVLFDDESVSVSPTRSLHAHHRGPRALAPLVPRPRRLATSSHLHAMRRRDGSASEAEGGERDLGQGGGREFSFRDAGLGQEGLGLGGRLGRQLSRGRDGTTDGSGRGPVTPTIRRPQLDCLESHGASGGDERWTEGSSTSEVEDALPASQSGSSSEGEEAVGVPFLPASPSANAHHVPHHSLHAQLSPRAQASGHNHHAQGQSYSPHREDALSPSSTLAANPAHGRAVRILSPSSSTESSPVFESPADMLNNGAQRTS